MKNYGKTEPHVQSGNCIVAAVGNLLWHWGGHGYGRLISGLRFVDLEAELDRLIRAEGGYANRNIPRVIKNYVKARNCRCFVTVRNRRHPDFAAVRKETAFRPCLLGFAAGSPYSRDVGHMTVCVGTRVAPDGRCYCEVMDGWKAAVTETEWGRTTISCRRCGFGCGRERGGRRGCLLACFVMAQQEHGQIAHGPGQNGAPGPGNDNVKDGRRRK